MMAGLVWKRVMDSTRNYSSNSIETESSRNPDSDSKTKMIKQFLIVENEKKKKSEKVSQNFYLLLFF